MVSLTHRHWFLRPTSRASGFCHGRSLAFAGGSGVGRWEQHRLGIDRFVGWSQRRIVRAPNRRFLGRIVARGGSTTVGLLLLWRRMVKNHSFTSLNHSVFSILARFELPVVRAKSFLRSWFVSRPDLGAITAKLGSTIFLPAPASSIA